MDRRFGGFRRATLLVAGLSFLQSCTSWQPMTVPEPAAAPRLPAAVRVTLTSRARWELDKPYFQGDSLIGTNRISYLHPRLAFPRAEILRLEDSRQNTTKTALLVAGIVVGGLAIAAVAVASSICGFTCGD